MALVSAAERKRKRRQKLKETGQYDKHNAKQAIDQQKYRKRQAEKEEKLPLDERSKLIKNKREECCKRVAKHGLLKTIEMEEKHETEKKRTKPFKQFLSFSKGYKLYQKPLTEGKQCKESFFANLQYNDAGDEPIERPKPVQTLSDDVK